MRRTGKALLVFGAGATAPSFLHRGGTAADLDVGGVFHRQQPCPQLFDPPEKWSVRHGLSVVRADPRGTATRGKEEARTGYAGMPGGVLPCRITSRRTSAQSPDLIILRLRRSLLDSVIRLRTPQRLAERPGYDTYVRSLKRPGFVNWFPGSVTRVSSIGRVPAVQVGDQQAEPYPDLGAAYASVSPPIRSVSRLSRPRPPRPEGGGGWVGRMDRPPWPPCCPRRPSRHGDTGKGRSKKGIRRYARRGLTM